MEKEKGFPPPHKIVREILRHYLEFEHMAATEQDPLNDFVSDYTLEYGPYSVSFLDLQGCLSDLSYRKQQAVYYNVIMDMKQEDVAKILGIRGVTVGQYVNLACMQIQDRILKIKGVNDSKE